VPTLVFPQIVFAAIWLGCVLVEAVFERAFDTSPTSRALLSRAHWRIDLTLKLPALSSVFVTGAALAAGAPPTRLRLVKIGFGALAIVSNLYCVWRVRIRLAAAQAADRRRWETIDHRQRRYGAVVLLVALCLGEYPFSGG
jgi:hypothetical protein